MHPRHYFMPVLDGASLPFVLVIHFLLKYFDVSVQNFLNILYFHFGSQGSLALWQFHVVENRHYRVVEFYWQVKQSFILNANFDMRSIVIA